MTPPPDSNALVLYVTSLVLDRLEAWRQGDQRRVAEIDLRIPKDQTTLSALWSAAFGVAERTLNVLDARQHGSASDLLEDFRSQVTQHGRQSDDVTEPVETPEFETGVPSMTVFQQSFGITSPAAEEHLRRQLDVVGVVNFLAHQLLGVRGRLTRSGAELTRLNTNNADVPVDLITSVRSGLTIARLALNHIALVLSQQLSVPPVLLQVLTRTALLGAGRVVFALGPDDPVERDRNVKIVLQQEGLSYRKGLNAMADFEQLLGLKPSDDYLSARLQQVQTLLSASPTPAGEARVLNEMAAGIAKRLATVGENEATAAVLGEHVALIWNLYSGVAHGFGWPTVHSQSLAPVDFLADFAMVVSVVHVAFDDALRLTE